MHRITTIPRRLKERYQLYRYVKPFCKRNEQQKIEDINPVLLFCQPRGGSTWLTEILLAAEGTMLIDEPLWRGAFVDMDQLPNPSTRKIPAVADNEFYYLQPISESEEWPVAKDIFTELFCGRIPSLGLYDQFGFSRMTGASNYIVKFNYAHLMMHWLIKQFGLKSILLVRHPCAVVQSQLVFPSFQDIRPVHGTFPDFRNADIFNEYQPLYQKLTTKEEWLAFYYGIAVKHAIDHPKNNIDWLTVSYEKLLTDFESEVSRIYHYTGLRKPTDINPLKHKPSKSTKGNSYEAITSNQQLGKWKSQLQPDQVDRILNVVHAMGIDAFSDDPKPDYDKLYLEETSP